MNRSSQFGIKIDFEKSRASYIFDKNRNKAFLDFFGMYATLPLGYNHPVFSSEEFCEDIKRCQSVKVTNCEVASDEAISFDGIFREEVSRGLFSHFHYSCTGALAIEAAVKTAIDYKNIDNPQVIRFKGSFHGINGYGGFLTDRFVPVNGRLDGFVTMFGSPLENPIEKYVEGRPVADEELVTKVLTQIEKKIVNEKNVACILVEPIQATYGDGYFPRSFFEGVRRLATQYDVPLIFDEVQVGFGGTGKYWYFEHLDIVPDIVVFGKKTQLSGIMVRPEFTKIFDRAIRLEVTWDADIIDMIRCRYILQEYRKSDVLNHVESMGKKLEVGLKEIDEIKNFRRTGLLTAFDFSSTELRNKVTTQMVEEGMLCNPTRDLTVRLRPNLNVSEEEIGEAINIIKSSIVKAL